MTTSPSGTPRPTTESFGSRPVADRPPSEQEARDAERAAGRVDVEQVGEHFREMTELGSEVEGEGEIEPRAH